MIIHRLNSMRLAGTLLIALAFSLFALPSQISSATDFDLEEIVFEGKSYSTVETILERRWLRLPKPKFETTSSSNPNGYEAKWEVMDDKIMLTSLKGGVENRDLDAKLLLGTQLPVHADWFTGTIDLIEGQLGNGVIGKRRSQWRLQVIGGVLVKNEFIGESTVCWPGRIGLSFTQCEKRWFIDAIAENSPADNSNRFQEGDEVIAVESSEWGKKEIEGIGFFDLVGYCRGPANSKVNITIRRHQSLDTISLQRVERFAE